MSLAVPVTVERLLKNPKLTDAQKWAALSRRKGVKKRRGAFVQVLMFPTFVVKKLRKRTASWVRDLNYASLESDTKFLTRKRRNAAGRKHFPETRMVGPFMVQERADTHLKTFNQYEMAIFDVAGQFEIEDIHEANVGFRRVKGKVDPTPVFIDVNLSGDPDRLDIEGEDRYLYDW
jgi:hypothetical protein